MGQFLNTGQYNTISVTGKPAHFQTLIHRHGPLAKVKQALACTCLADGHGSPALDCPICNGDGYVYTYQRRFLIIDENSKTTYNAEFKTSDTIVPFWNPILDVIKVENVTSDIQGGISTLAISSFDDTTITLVTGTDPHMTKRVTYYFDGWTYHENEQLVVDTINKQMTATGTIFNNEYQTGNAVKAYSDIAQVDKVWNNSTGKELTTYTVDGNMISTITPIEKDQMYINYYSSDLTNIIISDPNNRENNEVWTHELKNGEVKVALFPWMEISKGDLIILVSTVLYKNEILEHQKLLDKLWEVEIFALNDKIFDNNGKIYYINTDYILQGRYIKWISNNKPAIGNKFSIRYGYKPAYIVFEDNPQPNNAENQQFPTMVMAKSWSKISKNDIAKLTVNN
jgi:hypothetical protein